MEQRKIQFGFGLNRTRCFCDSFNEVEDLMIFAKRAWDNLESDYFDNEEQSKIYIGVIQQVKPSDFAPSLDDIADQINDSFYFEHSIDDDADVQIDNRKEAERLWKEFVDKYFDLPCEVVATWNIGVYDLKEHCWVEKFEDFEKYVPEHKR